MASRAYSRANLTRFWKWWCSPALPEARYSRDWWVNHGIIFTVFGVTGSSSVKLSGPVLDKLGIEGSFKEGPWSYRILYLTVMTPLYSAMLITNGTIAGRHHFFKNVLTRMWSRPLGFFSKLGSKGKSVPKK